ncbi:MAG: response regulator [Deltaproteobacteria bacterium]|nr:response regulator [Deltaproteobacteria bacterium]
MKEELTQVQGHGGVAQIEQLRIMLVDDDETVREALTELLGRNGWEVCPFNSAENAIEAMASSRYDIIVTDINMPGINGMDFMQKAKEAAPDMPIVMITGYPSIDVAVDAIRRGASDFLTKPFKLEELEIVIRKAVGEAKLLGGARKGSAAPDERAIGNLPMVARRRLEDKIKELSILHTITETLDDVHDKDDIFRKTMDLAQIIAEADRAFIMVAEQENREMVVRAASGYKDGEAVGKRFLLEDEPFKSVARNKCYSYTLIEDGGLMPLLSDENGPAGRKPLLLAPMLINREPVVMLGLAVREAATELTADALSILMNLTAKASLKLENLALTENIFSSIIGSINSLINALDARDTYTKDHSNRVTQSALKIARAMNCHQEVIDSISFAGPLHDVGKIGIRDDVLLKKGSFTPEEMGIMKSHVVRGEEILRPLNLLASEKAVVLYHHGATLTGLPERIFPLSRGYSASPIRSTP